MKEPACFHESRRMEMRLSSSSGSGTFSTTRKSRKTRVTRSAQKNKSTA